MPEAGESKILKYLIWVLVLFGLVILVNSWVLKPKVLPLPPIPTAHPPIKIDYETLASPDVKDLLPFEKIPFPEEIGRENPFEPY